MRLKTTISVFLSLTLAHCSAETSSDDEKLSRLQSDIDSVKQKMQHIILQKDTLNDQLAEIENQYGETAALLRDLKKQVEQKRLNLNEIVRKIHDNRQLIEGHGKELSGQIKTAYAMGRRDKFKLLLNQQDPVLSSRMMVYYGYINKIRLKKMLELEESVNLLNRLNHQQHQEAELLERDLEKKKLEQAELDQLKSQRNELLVKLSGELTSNEEHLTRLQESETKLKNLIAKIQVDEDEEFVAESPGDEESGTPNSDTAESASTSSNTENLSLEEFSKLSVDFTKLRGNLPWPIKGKLATDAENAQVETIRDGVLINADEGTEIHAVTTGKVVYSEWLRGYGLLMILDHGKGYMTLYAFNQSLYKKTGDLVRAGDVIASVGQSGGRSQPGLYFGIRKDGKAVDPLEWCPKPSRNETG